MLTSLIVWIIVGAIGGWLAGYAISRNTAFDAMDLVLGMIGAVVGGWLSRLIFGVDPAGISPWAIIMAFVGAVLVAFIYKKATGRTLQ